MWKTTVPSPVGPLQIVASARGVRALLWVNSDLVKHGVSAPPTDDPDHPILMRLTSQLGEYFAGTRQAFDVPLDPVGTEFQLAAWRALSDIPYGATRSYRDQAAAIGRPTAVRAIGAANGRNPISIVVPCHRVIGANGSLTGFGGGIEVKRFLLDHEAVHSGSDLFHQRHDKAPKTVVP